MAVTFGFYNSLANDRRYDAIQLSSIFDGIITDGIFASIPTSMMVTPSTGLAISVGEGRAWFNHTWTNNDAPLILTLSIPHVTLPRIDAIVLEVNASSEVRTNTIKIIEGTPGTTPANPTLVNSGTLHQYPLAYILVPVGLTTITSGHITNKVGTVDCPFVSAAMQDLDIGTITAQWQAEFETWFANLLDELTTNQATNLQNQINVDRQGGSLTDWSIPGTTNYLSEFRKMQMGCISVTIPAGFVTTEPFDFDFPIPFLSLPLGFLTVFYGSGTSDAVASAAIHSLTASAMSVVVTRAYPGSPSAEQIVVLNWMAIGPVA